MFERFTQDARDAVQRAVGLATDWQSTGVGNQHLVVAVAQAPGPAARALAWLGVTAEQVERAARTTDAPGLDATALGALGIDLDQVRARVEATFGAGALERAAPTGRRRGRRAAFDRDAKTTLELALREAVGTGHRRLDTGHLLLAVARQPGSAGHRLLTGLGLDPDEVRTAVRGAWAQGTDGGSAAAVVA